MTKIGTAVSIILCWLWLALAATLAAAQPSDTQRRWETLNTEIIQAYRSGDFAEGIGKAEQALALAHEAFGPRHSDTLQSMNNLAALYASQGRTREAEPLLSEVLQLRRELLGPHHSGTLQSMQHLALLYASQDRAGEAEPLLSEVLQLRREVLSSRHPDTLQSMNTLAFLYRSQGRHGEAEPLHREALETVR